MSAIEIYDSDLDDTGSPGDPNPQHNRSLPVIPPQVENLSSISLPNRIPPVPAVPTAAGRKPECVQSEFLR
jgi:hypothetical protein